MHFTKTALIALAPLFLTNVFAHRQYLRHEHHKHASGSVKAYQSAVRSGANRPYLSSTSGAPYGAGNDTVPAGSTGVITFTSSKYITVTATEASTNANSAANAPIAPSSSLAAVEASSSVCDAGTVTVTFNPTVTITASPNVPAVLVSQASDVLPSSNSAGVIPSQAATSSAADPIVVSSIQSSVAPAIQPSAATQAGSSSTSNTAVPSATSATSSSPGTKRGIIASGPDQASLVSAFSGASKISWLGDWYSGPPENLPSTMSFVPQMYGKQSTNDWTKNADAAVAKGDKYFLSFGEPETENDKLYMDPQDAVNLFVQQMQPYTDKVTIGAPAVLQNTKDFTWLSQFLDLCENAKCSIGFLAIHWFYVADSKNVQGFKDVVTNATTMANGKPVWLDNFQATGTNQAQQEFLQEVIPWLEAQEGVARYAYVTPDRSTGTGFLDPNGKLSSLGQWYATF